MTDDGFNVEGAGHAAHDLGLLHDVNWLEVLTIGRPRALRGERTEDSYEAERKMTWSELFFDLIFVTGARRLGDMLRENLLDHEAETGTSSDGPRTDVEVSGLTPTQYTFLFLALWALWSDQANYGTRFGVNDVYNFLHFGLYMAGVVGVVCSIGEGPERTRHLFAGFCFSYAVQVVTFLRVATYFCGTRTGRYGVLETVIGSVKLGMAVCGYMLAETQHWLVPVAALGTLNYTLFPILVLYHKCGLPPVYIPYHIEHFTERISLLLVIYLGDGVDNLTSVTSEERPPISRFVFGFLLLLALKVLLLDSCEVDVHRHAIRRSAESTLVFLVSMPCEAFGLGLISSGLAMALLSMEEAHIHAQRLLSYGSALLLAAFLATALAHAPPNHSAPGKRGQALARLLRLIHGWQQVLNVAAIVVCVVLGSDGIEAFRNPTTLLSILCAVLGALGAVNLFDEFIEGRMDALEEGKGMDIPGPEALASFDEPLKALKSAVEQNPRLIGKAIAMLEVLAAADRGATPGGPPAEASAADRLDEPLLAPQAQAQPQLR